MQIFFKQTGFKIKEISLVIIKVKRETKKLAN